MQDMINLCMLVCAITASLAFGVLAAHTICRGAFTALRMHSTSVASRELKKVSAIP